MPKHIIIPDVSPLIARADIGKLEILQRLYTNIIITDIVRNEIHADLPGWILVNTNYDTQQMKIPNSPLILDESKGRKAAKRLGLKVTGTVGIIIKAKKLGVIQSGKEVLIAFEEHGFWISQNLKAEILEQLGE